MPKTLAALPNSQYAADLELTSGKELFLGIHRGRLLDAEFVIFAVIPPNGLEEAVVVLENLELWKKFEVTGVRSGATVLGSERQRWQMKKSWDSLGTALGSPGRNLEDIEEVCSCLLYERCFMRDARIFY